MKDSQDWPQLQKFENRSYMQTIVGEEKNQNIGYKSVFSIAQLKEKYCIFFQWPRSEMDDLFLLCTYFKSCIVEWKTKLAESVNVALLVGIDRDSKQTDYAIAVRLMHSNSWGDEKRELQRFTALFIAKHLLASAYKQLAM